MVPRLLYEPDEHGLCYEAVYYKDLNEHKYKSLILDIFDTFL